MAYAHSYDSNTGTYTYLVPPKARKTKPIPQSPIKRGRPQKDAPKFESVAQSDGSRLYVCKNCGIMFLNSKQLNEHDREYHNSQTFQRNYMCSECGQFFQKASLLEEHINTHDLARIITAMYDKQIERELIGANKIFNELYHASREPFISSQPNRYASLLLAGGVVNPQYSFLPGVNKFPLLGRNEVQPRVVVDPIRFPRQQKEIEPSSNVELLPSLTTISGENGNVLHSTQLSHNILSDLQNEEIPYTQSSAAVVKEKRTKKKFYDYVWEPLDNDSSKTDLDRSTRAARNTKNWQDRSISPLATQTHKRSFNTHQITKKLTKRHTTDSEPHHSSSRTILKHNSDDTDYMKKLTKKKRRTSEVKANVERIQRTYKEKDSSKKTLTDVTTSSTSLSNSLATTIQNNKYCQKCNITFNNTIDNLHHQYTNNTSCGPLLITRICLTDKHNVKTALTVADAKCHLCEQEGSIAQYKDDTGVYFHMLRKHLKELYKDKYDDGDVSTTIINILSGVEKYPGSVTMKNRIKL